MSSPPDPKRVKARARSSAPSKDVLHEAALAYLTRTPATAATLTRVLGRKIATWARQAARASDDPETIATDVARCHEAALAIVARFREVGLVNDAAFAASRARSLSRAGRSRRAIAAHLTAKGVDGQTLREALPTDAAVELAAAVAFARKRRIGPFVREEPDPKAKQKALAAMARAGFAWSVCERVLRMDRDEAEATIQDEW
jgi:regulatory protein